MPCVLRPILLFAAVFSWYINGAFAQENPARLDSVIKQLDRHVEDTIQLALLISACESWYTSNNAFPYMQRLDTLSTKLLNSDDAAVRKRAIHARGAFHFFTGYHAKFARNIPLGLRSFHAAIDDFGSIGAQGALAETYDALGILFRAVGDNDQAFAAFLEERRIAVALQRPHINTQALVHLAACTADRGDFRTAALYLDSCHADSPADSSAVLNERARIAMLNGDKDATIKILHESLDRAKRSTNPWDQLPVLAPLARAHYANGEDAAGLLIAMECKRIGNEVGDQTAFCTCMVLVGEGERRAGQPKVAEREWLNALQLARTIGNAGSARELGDEGSVLYITDLLGKLYREQGRVAEALSMSDEWVLAQEQLLGMSGRDELLLLAFRKEQLIDSLAHVNDLERETLLHRSNLQSEKNRSIIIIALAALLAIIALGIWSRSRLLARTNATILAAQQQLVDSEKAHEADVVRTRIARDIHDQLGSDLTKLVMLSDEVNASETNGGANLETTTAIKRVARDATRALSDIVWAVDPLQDDLSSLVERIRSHSMHMLQGTAFEHTIDCVHTGGHQRIDPSMKRDIQLIHREALNNAIKYSSAQHISVSFHTNEYDVRLEVRDDGLGFQTTASLKGRGLMNMRERAERTGGHLHIQSLPGKGTSIIFALQPQMPLND